MATIRKLEKEPLKAPSGTGQREESKTRRKLRILQIASDEFRRNGFEKSRIDEIARRADVAPGTVYNYFPTKDLLLLELVALHRERSPKALASLLSNPPRDPVEALISFYKIMGEESLRYLDKPLWRHAVAAFTVGSWHEMTQKRWEHEKDLIAYQTSIIKLLQHDGSVPRTLNADSMAETIHYCGFYWWNQFLMRDDLDFESLISEVRRNFEFLFREVLSA